eukprot:TRINITY_DN72_c0_g1_i6.p2 TRINITY_DN72_c0_g1~~TRINITY_DN72_c0_g1_i6.p2  ORF type:complete len:314 (+),score=22.49 TRINITY_DN72_c0_g1_i6:470-1411(+)
MDPSSYVPDNTSSDDGEVSSITSDDEVASIPPNSCPIFDTFVTEAVKACTAQYPALANALTAAYQQDGLQRSRVWFASRVGMVTSTILGAKSKTTTCRVARGIVNATIEDFDHQQYINSKPPSAAAADGICLEPAAVDAVVARLKRITAGGPEPIIVRCPPMLRGGCGCCAASPDAIAILGTDLWFVEVKVPGGKIPNLLRGFHCNVPAFKAPLGHGCRHGSWYRQCAHHWRTGSSWWQANLPEPLALQPRGVILATYNKVSRKLSGWRRFVPCADELTRLSKQHEKFTSSVKMGREAFADILSHVRPHARRS